MAIIHILEFKKMHLDGATMIDGFPSVGLASTIAANYLIASLNLDQVAAIDSNYFPAMSTVYAAKPKFPARIYADEAKRLAVCVSEFTPNPSLDRPLAKTIFEWSQKQGCSLIITSLGLPAEKEEEAPHEAAVLGVGSTERARKRLDEAKVGQLQTGIILGISGVLMNLGRWENYDVIALLAKVHPQIADAMAAAKLVEAYNRLLPEVEVDVTPLKEEAEKIEARLKTLRTHVKPVEGPVPSPEIYA